jgi:predicted Zn finger-like uncharacterized protein
MKFVCDRCQTRYSIADEKVRQKILRIRCKTCGNVIVVQDEQGRGPGAAERHPPEADRPAPTAGSKAASASGPKAAPASGPKAAPASGPKTAPASGPRAAPASGPKSAPPPPPRGAKGADPLGGHVEWYIAVDGEQSGPFSRVEVAKRIHALGAGKTVHVWKEGMSGWKPPDEVSVVARELSLLRPTPPPPPHAPAAASPVPATKPAAAGAGSALARSAGGAATPPPVAPAPLAPTQPMAVDFDELVATTIDSGGFGDTTTTKKGKELRSEVAVPTRDEFGETTTQKTKDVFEAVTRPAGPGYSEVTTKKGKNLHELEASTPTAPGVDLGEPDQTPPPMKPLPPIGSKVAVKGPPLPRPGVAMPAPVVSFDIPPGTSPPALPSSSLAIPPAALVATPPPFVLPGTPLAPAAPPFKLPGSPSVPPPFGAPVAPLGTAPSGPSAPFAFPAAAPDLQPPSDLPTPRPVGVGPFVVPTATPPPTDLGLSPSRGGLFQRQPGLKYVVAILAIVGLIILLGLVILRGERDTRTEPTRAEPAAPTRAEPAAPTRAEPAAPTQTEKAKPVVAEPAAPAPPPAEEKPAAPVAPPSGKSHSGRSSRHGGRASERRERQAREKTPANPPRLAGARPNPFDEAKNVSQAQITAVVRNPANQAGLKSCYERALKMDNHLTSGRIDVTVSIGASGSVQRVVVNAPSSFIMVEPCIKSAVKRWVFPSSTEDYGTSFPLIMQGGM